MFEQHNEIYLKKETLYNSQGKRYSISSNRKVIGTIEETSTSKNIGNYFLKLLTLFSAVSLELRLLDHKDNKLGTITKEKGFNKDFLLYSEKGEHVATIKPSVKIKSPAFTVYDENGNNIIKVIGRYGATDFSVIDCRTEKQISTVKRRSLVYTTIKENLLNDDGYYIDNSAQESLTTFSLLAIGIMSDLYFFQN
ncbi:hypothetical protein [Bacillus sp. AK128]